MVIKSVPVGRCSATMIDRLCDFYLLAQKSVLTNASGSIFPGQSISLDTLSVGSLSQDLRAERVNVKTTPFISRHAYIT